ncbi:carbohydrate-binding module family 13 protein [Macrolepiota fuliginosa MF-IS2]|uniref:Carbohydrate-binding module family 13 protein n=1 Tax=Macrolepiota fuliginosa MF-IS2 TaxID=1400762 RepID=A0A9P5X2K8_9AGAR|nr:carbohydrate-binding module family 13 protein [Macrolepiota fuliginosa MF-IS2]
MFRLLSQITALSAVLSPVLGQQVGRHFEIVNSCPSAIELRINGTLETTLAPGGNTTRDYGSWFGGYMYSNANGGNLVTGRHIGRAGFHGEQDYYWIVVDHDYLNTGISIAPINKAATDGFCAVVSCTSANCSDAFPLTAPPTSFATPITGTPPNALMHECPGQNVGYTITFCPDGNWPTAPVAGPPSLHPSKDSTKCLGVRGDKFENGTPVQIYDCNGLNSQSWILERGSTKVRSAGTNFCLDAGSTPGNAVGMKIWECYDSLPAQQWYYTDDNRVELEGTGLCLDLTNGLAVNSNQVQTWKCTDGNTNQIWT